MSIRTLAAAWNRVFFEPIAPTGIALFRIAFGLIVISNCALLAPDLMTWFGDRGVLPVAASRALAPGPRLSLFSVFTYSDFSVQALFALWVASAFFLTIGFYTRVSALIVFVSLVTFHHRNMLILNGADTIMRIIAFFLIFSQAGAALSLDRLLRRARAKECGPPQKSAPWAQRLIQLQLMSIYLMTFLWKAQGSMWIDGTATYYSSRLQEFWRYPVPYVFEHLWTIKLITWSTLALELALGTLVAIRELRYWLLLGGVLLHAGIDYSMNIPLFSPLMVAAYLTFIRPEDYARLFSFFRLRTCTPAGWRLKAFLAFRRKAPDANRTE